MNGKGVYFDRLAFFGNEYVNHGSGKGVCAVYPAVDSADRMDLEERRLILEQQQLAKYEGYAIVQQMGHKTVAGFVTTEYFGSVAMLRVVQQEQPPEEITISEDQWINGRMIYAGSKVRILRQRAEQYVAASSLYAFTPCTAEEAHRSQPKTVEVIEAAERKTLAAAASKDPDDDEYDDDPFETDRECGSR